MYQPEPVGRPFNHLIANIEQGLIKIPQFQRDFVWTKKKSAFLLDSILKKYPIGTFILWRTKEVLRVVRNLGDFPLAPTPPGESAEYVLDGQQRLTTLFAAVKGLKIKREDEDKIDDFSELHIDLLASEDQDIVTLDIKGKQPQSVIKLTDLLNANLPYLASFPKELHDRLSDYKNRIESYQFSVVLVQEAPIDVATEIFTRLNVTGSALSVFEIMVAKTFDEARAFDLAEKYAQLARKLKDVDYHTIPPAVILQTVAGILAKECSKKAILKLDKRKVIDGWPKIIDAIERAVDYFRDFYRIPVSKLLPYGSLLVPFAYFFFHHPNKPTGDRERYLQDLFWRVSLAGRFSVSLETRLAQEIRRVDDILKGKLPTYDYPVSTSATFVEENGWFSAGRSYIKAILCLLAYHQPKSFVNNAIVRLSNDFLKRANSKNYHHFFPRAFLEKKGRGYWEINHILNITFVDDYLNKREIRDKAPSLYMKTFKKKNPRLSATMKTHLIDIDTFGVWEDDYDTFRKRRAKAIARELAKRIIPAEVDEAPQEINTDDYEDPELAEEAETATEAAEAEA
jgi:hypothetical protein